MIARHMLSSRVSQSVCPSMCVSQVGVFTIKRLYRMQEVCSNSGNSDVTATWRHCCFDVSVCDVRSVARASSGALYIYKCAVIPVYLTLTYPWAEVTNNHTVSAFDCGVWDDPGSNLTADGCVFRGGYCDMQPLARAAHLLQCLGQLSLAFLQGQ